MGLKREFEVAVKDHFLAITPLLDAALLSVVESKCSSSTRFFLFEYDSPHFSDAFTVSAWPMDRKGKVTGEGHWLLKGKAVAVPQEIYDDPKYEGIEPWETASKLLERWLVARWKRLRSKSGVYPAFVGHHDSYFKTDLKTGTRINWDEVLEAARATSK